ncbi:MAG: hypothetical protein P8Y36_12200 [Alphaproteobacteria bacterium]
MALAAKISGYTWALRFYDFIRDTSLLIVTVIAAYMADVLQKRTTFLQNLREQWREIVETKAALIYFCHLKDPTLEDYLEASKKLSQTIDTMRIVYKNVGETPQLIGLYPYSPLHHMFRIMVGLDPRVVTPTHDDKFKARGEIWDAFNAIREHFVDEFDIEEPTRPVLIHSMKRTKRDGAAPFALDMAEAQRTNNEQK